MLSFARRVASRVACAETACNYFLRRNVRQPTAEKKRKTDRFNYLLSKL